MNDIVKRVVAASGRPVESFNIDGVQESEEPYDSNNAHNPAVDEEFIYSDFLPEKRVYPDGVHHIGMIDFLSKDEGEVKAALLAHFPDDKWILFHSGRSYHAYFPQMNLTQDEFAAFLGKVLLMNTNSEPNMIDVRWVAACLIRGSASLRITRNNTEHYLKVPTYVVESL